MKKLFYLLLSALIVTLVLAACNPNPSFDGSGSTSASTTSEQAEETDGEVETDETVTTQTKDTSEEESTPLATESATESEAATTKDTPTTTDVATNDGDTTSPEAETVYTDFTAEEKNVFIVNIGEVIPFPTNTGYEFSGLYGDDSYEDGIMVFVHTSTPEYYSEYRGMLVGYTLVDASADEDGDVWYTYTKGDICLVISSYGETNSIDIRVMLITEDGGYVNTDFTDEEKLIMLENLGEVIPFIPNNAYVFAGYNDDDNYAEGIHFYAGGNTPEEFQAYLEEFSAFTFDGTSTDDDGDLWYYYSNDSLSISVGYYIYSDLSVTDVYVAPTESTPETSQPTSINVTYPLSSYATGAQYENVTKKLDDYVTVSTYNQGCHLTTQLRIYQSTDKDGYAILKAANGYSFGEMTFSAGYKNATLAVYGSTNGSDWTLIKKLNVSSAYSDMSVNASGYSQIKLDAEGAQVRIQTISAEIVSGAGSILPPVASDYTYTDFKASEKTLFNTYIGEVIPFLPNDEYYVEGYYEETDYENGMCFYTVGNTNDEYLDYLSLIEASGYEFLETYVDDEYGDTWYCYSKNDDIYIDVTYYTDSGYNVMELYVYSATLSSDGEGGGSTDDSGSSDNSDLLTNDGKGLPSSQNGVYNVDFTDATVKSVADQGYYLGGCPTVGSPAVLVIPVEFSDALAKNTHITIDKLNKIFNGNAGETDYYSLNHYYYASSYGKLDLDITVIGEWFKPQYTSSYYMSQTIDYYGTDTEIGDQMILNEALAYYSRTMDLSKYDTDNNGMIDAVILVNTLDIDSETNFNWAYRYWNIYTDTDGNCYEYDNVSANDYIWMSGNFIFESMTDSSFDNYSNMSTYTFIHEFGHILGADDYYDTSYSSDSDPVDGYDVMSAMLGDHNAYSKFNYGWITSSRLVVTESSVTLTLDSFTESGDTIILANNWDSTLGAYQEYYVVVYYTNDGLNSGDGGYFEDEGILVYHVNSTLFSEVQNGETYYDVYNNNTDPSDEYGTENNLIEYVKTSSGDFVYTQGDSLPTTYDDGGNKLGYSFTVDSISGDTATLTFTKLN